jgi:hypothetical protein
MIIVSRQFSVGPDGLFMPGPNQGPVTISINFFRPIPHPEQAPDLAPAHQCTYEIKYNDDVVRTFAVAGNDEVAALLAAMRHAVIDLDYRYVEEWRVSIPRDYLDDMRMAG